MLSNDLCSENPCDEAQSGDFELSIEIDNWRIKMIWDFDCDYDCNFDYPLKRIKGWIDGDNYQTLLMTFEYMNQVPCFNNYLICFSL